MTTENTGTSSRSGETDEVTIPERFDELQDDILKIHERLELATRKLETGTSTEDIPDLLGWTQDALHGVLTAVRELRDAVDERTSAC